MDWFLRKVNNEFVYRLLVRALFLVFRFLINVDNFDLILGGDYIWLGC